MSISSIHLEIPRSWTRKGLVIARDPQNHGKTATGDLCVADYGVVGDPCIVWDEEIAIWRMFLFRDPPGHAQAVSTKIVDGLPREWSQIRPLNFEGPDFATHKPYVVQLANRPNQAACIRGEYWLVSVMILNGRKFIQRAKSRSLAGPWVWDAEPLIPTGGASDFDEKHTDAVTGFYFPERDEVLYFYMGYPTSIQNRAISPFGSAQALAIQSGGGGKATKMGPFLEPVQEQGHWASGWLGGFQLLPGKTHRWIAVLNASPTAPDPWDTSEAKEEPAPSLGGWAYCDEEWPVKNWHLLPQPMEWITEIPKNSEGEGTNLWRQHALALPDGRIALFYNSGFYGREQLYMKLSS